MKDEVYSWICTANFVFFYDAHWYYIYTVYIKNNGPNLVGHHPCQSYCLVWSLEC